MDTEFNSMYGLVMSDSCFEPCDSDADIAPAPATLVWRTRYGGHVEQAYIGDKAVAGISGPWSGQFALTWWGRPQPRQLELYDSLEQAKHVVEAWALRMRHGAAIMPAVVTSPAARAPRRDPAMPASLFGRLRNLLPGSAASHATSIERLRRTHSEPLTDLGGLHFGAQDA